MGSRRVARAGASPKLSCLEELSAMRRRSLVERFEGGLHDGEGSTQRFTEHCCYSCICICIHLCLKSLALDTNPSHFLHREGITFRYVKSTNISNLRGKIFLTTLLFTRSAEHTSQVTALKCIAAKPAN